MTDPRPLGPYAKGIVEGASNLTADNMQCIFDAVTLIHAGDKDGAILLLKRMGKNETIVFEALTLLRADKLHMAADKLLEAGE